ncbi:flagellar biosynthesis protein FlhB [Niveibacterium terrae]|uniref:flagellar biosynthesis protein FlhB n=1 Tax=Niveibacterium terrae TaxID=3373598 RepID=UPI003A8DE8D0
MSKAREEGNVPASRELGTFLVLITGVVTLWAAGSWMSVRAAAIMRHGLTLDRRQVFEAGQLTVMLHSLTSDGLTLLVPLFAALIIAAIIGPMLLSGFHFSATAFSFKASRLNPISGLTRVFSMNGVAELVKALLKALMIGGIGVWVVLSRSEKSLALLSMSVNSAIVSFGEIVFGATVAMVSGLALVAAVDVPFQLWQYYKGLRMTKEEVKQEYKESEGDPKIKGQIRQRQREMARGRMMQEVPKADVVVTNPTHYAVALKYDGASMRAPRVVAKGADLVAAQIREIARSNNVPLLEAPPLARALFRHTEINEDVPAALYTAVAEVMAWVYTLRQAAAAGVPAPVEPDHLSVPAGMDPAESANA